MATETKITMTPADRRTLPARVATHDDGHGHKLSSVVIEFTSLAAMAETRDRCPAQRSGLPASQGWTRNWSDYRNEVLSGEGDADLAETIRAAVANITAGSSSRPTWQMAPAGAYPIVAAAIGGDPFSMRARAYEESDSAPIRIYIPLTCSAAIAQEQYAQVLTDCCAAVLMLSERRQVELIAYTSLDARQFDKQEVSAAFVTCPIDYKFGDYRQLAVWCDRSMGRTVGMGIVSGADTRWSGGWPFDTVVGHKGSPASAYMVAQYRKHLNLTDEDVIIPPLWGRDGVQAVRKRMQETLEANGITIDWSKA